MSVAHTQRLDHLLAGLKKLADEFEPGYRTHGPMRIRFLDPSPGKDAPWRIVIEAGYDHQYGGTITIEASKTGKSLRVWRLAPDADINTGAVEITNGSARKR